MEEEKKDYYKFKIFIFESKRNILIKASFIKYLITLLISIY